MGEFASVPKICLPKGAPDHNQDQHVPNAKTAHRPFLLYRAMIPRQALNSRDFLRQALIFLALFSLIAQARQIMSRQGKTKASFGSAASRTSAPGSRSVSSGAAAHEPAPPALRKGHEAKRRFDFELAGEGLDRQRVQERLFRHPHRSWRYITSAHSPSATDFAAV
jgi:hypothetical protein